MANTINYTRVHLNLNNCNLCPNNCNANRSKTIGLCKVKDKIKIAKYYLHQYEEPFISLKKGSGTIFFCGCSLGCVFCQNYDLSRNNRGKEITPTELANIFIELENMGAENINLVTPTHYANQIISAFKIYKPKIPIVYNTHGYEKIETLEKLNDYIDVYLPDMKYFSPEISKRYCGKENYFEVADKAIKYMLNKPLEFVGEKMTKGVCVRHLVLPQNVDNSKKILDWFNPIKDKAYINIMSQYTPFGALDNYPELKRKITRREYDSVLEYAINLGLKNALYQEFESQSTKYIPDWDW